LADDLKQYLHDRQALVENHLSVALRVGDGCPPSLMEAMRYCLLAPGKRLRPLLVILAAEACGAGAENALPAACAVEMVHTYSLIHDDLPAMDNDDVRRGQPTCHKQFGEALAILAGDALLTLAFQVLAEGYPPATAAACCRELARGAGAGGMVGGQVDDLAWEESAEREARSAEREAERPDERSALRAPRSAPSLVDLEHLHARKTGALFRTCLRLGVLAAQGQQQTLDSGIMEELDAYGRCFGLLFQITDDLLDVESSADAAGKRVQKDAARGKLTYPGFLGVTESRRRAEHLGRKALAHLLPLGPSGQRLGQLVRLILERNR
jgi:geranylgeranyl diphosphate synthase type II